MRSSNSINLRLTHPDYAIHSQGNTIGDFHHGNSGCDVYVLTENSKEINTRLECLYSELFKMIRIFRNSDNNFIVRKKNMINILLIHKEP